MTDAHPLDNPVWSALTSNHRDLAQRDGVVVHYPDDVSPFGAVERLDDATRAGLETLRRPIWLLRRDLADANTTALDGPMLHAHQMVAPRIAETDPRATPPANPYSSRALAEHDVEAMLDLTGRTRPGPFLRATLRFGGYLGIFEGSSLVAMAGRRMHPAGFCEVSAVCCDPDHQGRGLATALTLAVARAVQDGGDEAFLHVAANNTRAIALYEHLGFVRRATLGACVVGAPTA